MDGSVDGKKGHALFRLRRGLLKEEGLYSIRPRPMRPHRRGPGPLGGLGGVARQEEVPPRRAYEVVYGGEVEPSLPYCLPHHSSSLEVLRLNLDTGRMPTGSPVYRPKHGCILSQVGRGMGGM